MPDPIEPDNTPGSPQLGDNLEHRVTKQELGPQNLNVPLEEQQGYFPYAEQDKMQSDQLPGYDSKKLVGGPKEIDKQPNPSEQQGPSWGSRIRSGISNWAQKRAGGSGRGAAGVAKDAAGKGGDGENDKTGSSKEAGKAAGKIGLAAAKGAAAGGGLPGAAVGAGKEMLQQAFTNPKAFLQNVKQLQKYQRFLSAASAVISTAPVWGPVVLILLAIAIIGFILFKPDTGSTPPDVVGLSGFARPGEKNWANPDGLWLDIMTPSIAVKTGKGQAVLSLESTSGRFSFECQADQLLTNGRWACSSDGEVLSPISRGVTSEEIKYYVTARFPFVLPKFNGGSKELPSSSAPDGMLYSGKRLVVINPAKKKAVIGVAAEWGNAPWAGVCKADSSNPNRVDPSYVDSPHYKSVIGANYVPCRTQKDDWDKVEAASRTTFVVPTSFRGRIAGGPPTLQSAIGATDDGVNDKIIIGFLDPKYYDKYPVGKTFNIDDSMIRQFKETASPSPTTSPTSH